MIYIKWNLLLLLIMLIGWFIAIICDTNQDKNRCLVDENIKSDKEYFISNLRISLVEIVSSFVIVLIGANTLGIGLIVVIYGTIFYHLIKKLENTGGYTERLFDIVEAFCFISILANDLVGCIFYTLIIIGWIVIARKLDNEDRSFYLSLLALAEVWVLCLASCLFGNNKSPLTLLCLILLPHSLLKLFNSFIVYIYGRFFN